MIKLMILLLFMNSITAFEGECLDQGGAVNRLCLVEKSNNCLFETEDFCQLDTDIPVARPILFEGEQYMVYLDEEWNQWELKNFFYELARGFQQTNRTEMLIAEHYGLSLFQLRAAMNYAKDLELQLCGTNHSLNDEADALRHFTFSAYLAYYENEEGVRAFLMAHEALGKRSLKTMGTFKKRMRTLVMDYHNNNLGVDFALNLPMYLSKQGLKEEIMLGAYSHLQQNEMYLLSPGKTDCQLP